MMNSHTDKKVKKLKKNIKSNKKKTKEVDKKIENVKKKKKVTKKKIADTDKELKELKTKKPKVKKKTGKQATNSLKNRVSRLLYLNYLFYHFFLLGNLVLSYSYRSI